MTGNALREQYPAGCFIGFNAGFDRKSAEQLILVCGQAVQNEYDEINLCLGSLGGTLDDVYYVINILEAFPVKLITHNVSTVQSAANLVFLCGDERYAVPGSTFFFHQTHFPSFPDQQINQAFMVERLKAIEDHDTRCAAFYLDKTGQPAKKVREWCNAEILMTTDDAMANGLIHGVKQLDMPPKSFFHQVVVP
ncbi:MAG: ATP-dependent Clp protease proteolytic subunit [Methyloceanibacter sp.]